jgi:hypothetical protein
MSIRHHSFRQQAAKRAAWSSGSLKQKSLAQFDLTPTAILEIAPSC